MCMGVMKETVKFFLVIIYVIQGAAVICCDLRGSPSALRKTFTGGYAIQSGGMFSLQALLI